MSNKLHDLIKEVMPNVGISLDLADIPFQDVDTLLDGADFEPFSDDMVERIIGMIDISHSPVELAALHCREQKSGGSHHYELRPTGTCAPSSGRDGGRSPRPRSSIWEDSTKEIDRYKWIESEKAGRDLGETAVRQWIRAYWWTYLRARWLEHLEGKVFWVELDAGDFGKLQRLETQHPLLLDCILDRLKSGQENLAIMTWAMDWNIPMEPVMQILLDLDVNGRRMACRFDNSSHLEA